MFGTFKTSCDQTLVVRDDKCDCNSSILNLNIAGQPTLFYPQTMPRSLAAVSLLLHFLTPAASALSSCVAFDVNWNLLAFNFDGKDYNAGVQESWNSGD